MRFLHELETATEDDNRQLVTVLFTNIVGSTEQLAAVGDKVWRDLLDHHDDTTERAVVSFRGRVVNKLDDGMLATFDGLARAVGCAMAIRDVLAARGIKTLAGLPKGAIELCGQDVAGMAVHTGARVAALAGEGDVLVSSTVKDQGGGFDIEFEDRAEDKLKGVPGSWRLYAVEG